jgi:hypothetical protein
LFGKVDLELLENKKQEGKLKKVNGKWFIDYITEPAGKLNWHHCLPIYELEKDSEKIADLKLVEKFNKSVIELEGLDVEWTYKLTDGFLDFGYEYSTLS